jgi:hypothetical protein
MKLVVVGFVALCGALTLCLPEIDAQSSRLAEFGGLGMSFNICRGTLGSLAMLTAIRNASSRVSLFVDSRRWASFSKYR